MKKDPVNVRKKVQKAAITTALEKNAGNVSDACKAVGIGRATYYRWLESDTEFATKCRDIKEGIIDLAEGKLISEIENSNLTAIIFYLKCQAKHRGYSEHHTAPDIEERKILNDYASGKIDVIQAGTQYALIGRPLPDVIKMQLSKMEPPEPDAGDDNVYTDEELEADFLEMQEKMNAEKTRWLPNRREEVAQLKRDLDGNRQATAEAMDGDQDGDHDD